MGNLIRERAEKAIREKTFPGCVIAISRNGAREILPLGGFTYDKDSSRVTEDTVYDLASITKSIPTASLALQYIEEGKLRLDDTVKKFIPEFEHDHGATIEDLLQYRVRGVRMSELQLKTFEQIRTYVFEHGFDGPRGERAYTNLPSYVLGVILERIGGMSLAALAHEHFFEPLEMERTTFFPSASDCAPTEIKNEKVIQGTVHDESARVFAKARRSCGHAGLFSTAPDLLNFLEALLDDRLEYIRRGAEKGLGWELLREHKFGKTGFAGTNIVLDPKKKIGLVILSNRTFPERPKDSSAINAFREDIAKVVFL